MHARTRCFAFALLASLAPADRRFARNERQESALAGQTVERRTGIGDGEEAARGGLPELALEAVEEEGEQQIRLESRARLARHHHPGGARIDRPEGARDLLRMGRIENVQPRRSRPPPRRAS